MGGEAIVKDFDITNEFVNRSSTTWGYAGNKNIWICKLLALGVIRNCGHYDCVPAELVADYFGFVYGSNYICCAFCSCMDSGYT